MNFFNKAKAKAKEAAEKAKAEAKEAQEALSAAWDDPDKALDQFQKKVDSEFDDFKDSEWAQESRREYQESKAELKEKSGPDWDALEQKLEKELSEATKSARKQGEEAFEKIEADVNQRIAKALNVSEENNVLSAAADIAKGIHEAVKNEGFNGTLENVKSKLIPNLKREFKIFSEACPKLVMPGVIPQVNDIIKENLYEENNALKLRPQGEVEVEPASPFGGTWPMISKPEAPDYFEKQAEKVYPRVKSRFDPMAETTIRKIIADTMRSLIKVSEVTVVTTLKLLNPAVVKMRKLLARLLAMAIEPAFKFAYYIADKIALPIVNTLIKIINKVMAVVATVKSAIKKFREKFGMAVIGAFVGALAIGLFGYMMIMLSTFSKPSTKAIIACAVIGALIGFAVGYGIQSALTPKPFDEVFAEYVSVGNLMVSPLGI